MRRKRWLALMMTVTMGVGLLAGCGSDAADSKGQATGNTEGAGGAAEVDFDEEPYEATLMYWVANDARDVDSVEEAFNKLTMEQLNMKVHLQPVTFGTYTQQITMVLSSDDDLDVFPLWGASAGGYIESDYIVDLNEYLEDYGQDIIDIVGMEDIQCAQIGDFLTGIPTMHERTNPVTFVMRTDLLEETGYKAEDVKTAEDLTPIFEKVHELHPEMTVYGGANSVVYPGVIGNVRMDPLGGGNYGVLLNEGQDTTVSNWYESDDYINACKLVRSWNQAGYTSADFATCTDYGEALMAAGNLFCFTTSGKPNTKAEKDAMTGYDTTCITVTDNVCYTQTTSAVLYGIASNSKDPAKAMMLLNWIYATKEANDLLNWGVEDKDYVVTDDGTIDYPEGVTADNVGYHQDYGWALPNQYNSYTWTGNNPDVWDQYQEVRDTALKSKAYGFYFDSTPVFNEITALNAVADEYRTSIETGSVDTDTAIAEFNQKLYDAGLQTVMDEKQAQLDEWLAQQ